MLHSMLVSRNDIVVCKLANCRMVTLCSQLVQKYLCISNLFLILIPKTTFSMELILYQGPITCDYSADLL